MRAIRCCFFASVCYAAELVITDKYLKNVSTILMTFFLGLGVAIFAAPFVVHQIYWKKETVVMPQGWQWTAIFILMGFNFAADWLHFEALRAKAGATAVATFYLLIPVICTMMKGEWPSSKMICAWIFAGIALFLIKEELLE